MNMKKLLVAGLLIVGSLGSTGCSPQSETATLTVHVQGQGFVQTAGEGSFALETVVDVKALPDAGWQFLRWEGAVAETSQQETTILMDKSKTIRAVFVPEEEPEIKAGPGGLITRRGDGSTVVQRTRGEADIEYIMLHAISDAAANPGDPYNMERIRAIFDDYSVEAHYVIDRDGAIWQFVQDDQIARHAGAGSWMQDPRLTNAMNRYAIGIELLGIGTRAEMKSVIGSRANTLVNSSDRGFTDAQYVALNSLLQTLQERYEIPAQNIISHHAYDPGRKWDPGELFDWSRIRQQQSDPRSREGHFV